MVPKIHAKGSSFKGIAQYLLHDPDRAPTSDRVAWTQTLNLASDDPNLAWKLMAASALDADRLKAQAGVKNTGRKSDKSVLHFTLRWSGDEEAPIPEEMMRAARQAIKSLGAEDYQALIVAHCDKDPHIHCVINRVSMEDGKMLSSSKEKLNLSKWALGYEKERGEVLCQQREINWRARDRGEHTRGEKDIPRHVFEQIRSNDNTMSRDQVKAVWKQHRGKDGAVGRRQRETRDAQAVAWVKLQGDHKDRQAAINKQLGGDIFKAKQRVRDEYRSTWDELYHEHQAEQRLFEQNEATFFGRIKNKARAIDLKAILKGSEKKRVIGESFDALGSKGARLELLKKDQAKRDAELGAEQKASENTAAGEQRQKNMKLLQENRGRFQTERADVVLRQSMQQAKARAEWAERVRQRRREHIQSRQAPPTAGPRNNAKDKTEVANTSIEQQTKPSDLLPKDQAADRARQIDEFKQRMNERAAERRNNRDRDKDDRDR